VDGWANQLSVTSQVFVLFCFLGLLLLAVRQNEPSIQPGIRADSTAHQRSWLYVGLLLPLLPGGDLHLQTAKRKTTTSTAAKHPFLVFLVFFLFSKVSRRKRTYIAIDSEDERNKTNRSD
jgi:hypothetical protein